MGDGVRHGSGGARARLPFWSLEFARHAAIVTLAILVYFGVRGRTEANFATAARHGYDVLAFEKRLGIDLEQRFQGLIIDHPGLVTLANWVYIWGHWPVIIGTLVWLYAAHRQEYLLLRNAMFISGAIGLVIFVTYAVAPPRLLDMGMVDTVTERSHSYRVLQPPGLVNRYAALPSLHLGWNLLVGIVLFRATRNPLVRVFAVASPLLMAFAVVATGNHYLVDPVLGCVVALVGLAGSVALTPRLLRIDARVRQRLGERGVVEDETVDTPGEEPPRGRLVGDRPAEDEAVAPLELRDQGGGGEPAVQGDAVHGDPRRHPAQEEQLGPVAGRADRPDVEAPDGPPEQPPRLG
ncbi:MAG TPA: phosphatase PAP2 family protein [Nocardioides sp.]|uniref:phosphatase PAP2 family protein n=1 Tax=Nocardioides sp. TaxID=35761 RepID=UPI002BF09EC6|nr:phosphatase PAP2 family protein [Nocardioides sp.]HQR28088.1 phosphatase PAP2 family protein [Nocardioides sp.]